MTQPSHHAANDGSDELDAAIAGNAAPMAGTGLASGTGLMAVAQTRLLDLAEDGKAELVKGFDGLVAFANEIAAKVDSMGGGSAIAAPVADLAYQAAGIIGDLQTKLRDKPIEELLDDGRALVRESPGLAGGVAFAAAFLVTRLIKASR